MSSTLKDNSFYFGRVAVHKNLNNIKYIKYKKCEEVRSAGQEKLWMITGEGEKKYIAVWSFVIRSGHPEMSEQGLELG